MNDKYSGYLKFAIGCDRNVVILPQTLPDNVAVPHVDDYERPSAGVSPGNLKNLPGKIIYVILRSELRFSA